MNNKDINKKIDETLNSFDGAQKAAPRLYFFTRLKAAMERSEKSGWEQMGRFISRPIVVIAGLCSIIVVNILMMTFYKAPKNNTLPEQQYASGSTDEFSGSVATIYDIENQ